MKLMYLEKVEINLIEDLKQGIKHTYKMLSFRFKIKSIDKECRKKTALYHILYPWLLGSVMTKLLDFGDYHT